DGYRVVGTRGDGRAEGEVSVAVQVQRRAAVQEQRQIRADQAGHCAADRVSGGGAVSTPTSAAARRQKHDGKERRENETCFWFHVAISLRNTTGLRLLKLQQRGVPRTQSRDRTRRAQHGGLP